MSYNGPLSVYFLVIYVDTWAKSCVILPVLLAPLIRHKRYFLCSDNGIKNIFLSLGGKDKGGVAMQSVTESWHRRTIKKGRDMVFSFLFLLQRRVRRKSLQDYYRFSFGKITDKIY
jgi:hypothetical protein